MTDGQEQIRKMMHEWRKQIARDPNDVSAIFALANAHVSLEEFVPALRNYEKVTLSATQDTNIRWAAFLNVGELRGKLGYYPTSESLDAFNAAFHLKPYRVEPLYQAAKLCREKQSYPMAFVYATAAVAIPVPENETFMIDIDTYTWKVPLEFAWAAAHMGFKEMTRDAMHEFLESNAPTSVKDEALNVIKKVFIDERS